jgi:hypothetical protein
VAIRTQAAAGGFSGASTKSKTIGGFDDPFLRMTARTVTVLDPILARGVRIVAVIHHSHGIKAALAVGHLRARFPHWSDALWHEALLRAGWFDEPVVDRPVDVSAFEVKPERAHTVLARAVIPRAYAATRSWAAANGVEGIVRFYLDEAAAEPGYLGHRLSILLALGDAWVICKDSEHRDLFLDRFTEFLLASQFKGVGDGVQSARLAAWGEASAAALASPGYFGHHVICLAWIGRCRNALSDRQWQRSLGWVVEAATTTYPDAEDNVRISDVVDAPLGEEDLDGALRDLLLRGVRNIHLLTLADAIAWLWDTHEDARPSLVNLARHYVERAEA